MGSRLDRVTDWEAFAQAAGYRVGRMAVQAKVTRRLLHCYFLRNFECHPDLWLENLKLRIASEMLAQGKKSKEIAGEIGFAHRSTFCQFFQRLTGLTPQAFAKTKFEKVPALISRNPSQETSHSVSIPRPEPNAFVRGVGSVVWQARHPDIPPSKIQTSQNPTQKAANIP